MFPAPCQSDWCLLPAWGWAAGNDGADKTAKVQTLVLVHVGAQTTDNIRRKQGPSYDDDSQLFAEGKCLRGGAAIVGLILPGALVRMVTFDLSTQSGAHCSGAWYER
jgi:hypothetical protein